MVNAGIDPAFENSRHEAIARIVAVLGLHARRYQHPQQIVNRRAGQVVIVDAACKGSVERIERDNVALVGVAEPVIAEVLALLRLAQHAAHRIYGALLGSNLGEYRQHALVHVGFHGAARNVFLAAFQRHARKLQLALVVELIHHVSGEAIQLPHDHDIEQALLRVIDHAQEIGAVIRPAGKGIVRVHHHKFVVFSFAVPGASGHLVFNRSVALFIA